MMIRRVIDRMKKLYEEIGATSDREGRPKRGKEDSWRERMERFDGVLDRNPAEGLMNFAQGVEGGGEESPEDVGGEPGGGLNPGDEPGEEIHGEIGAMERSQGELPGVQEMRRLGADEVEEMWEQARGTGERVWRENRLQSGEVEKVVETAEERDMRLLGPLTWHGTDGWMKKQAVEGSGRVWTRGVGWVKRRGRRVTDVLGEMRGRGMPWGGDDGPGRID